MVDVLQIAEGTKIKITLVKSPIGYGDKQKATVRALGLRRMHATREIVLGASLRGMLFAVRHLVQVELAEKGN
jgi:large subunit ribosomal protein L30